MKKLLSLSLAALLGLAPLSGCAAQAQPVTAPAVTVTAAPSARADAALASLGLELVKATRGEGGTLLSPLSIALALAMAANGAQGETLAQLENLLAGEGDLAELNAACAYWMEKYTDLGGSSKSSIANSLWLDPDGQIKDSFTGTCQGIFDAQVFHARLSDPAIVGELNGWVSEHTGKMIPKLIDRPFSGDAAALLVNALYLENQWASPFDPNDNRDRDFTHAGGGTEKVAFLQKSHTSLRYLEAGGAQGVVLPYDDGKLGFFALMPDLSPDAPELGDWLAGLDGETLTGLLTSAEERTFLTLALPKFEAEWKGALQDLLAGMGAELAFTPGADFSTLGDHPDGYYIGQVLHATKLEVNEKGTKAAAATAAVMACGTAMPPEDAVTLILDHPFLYGIADLETGVPLFLGTFE